MKNKKLILLIIFVSFLLIGCGKNENVYECKKVDGNDTIDLTLTFDKDVISTIDYKEVMTFGEMDAYIDIRYYETKEKFETLKGVDGLTYSVKKKKKEIVVTANADYNNFKDDGFAFVTVTKNMNKNDALFNLMNSGYTCKQ